MTCWRRLRDWAQAGMLEALQQALLDELGEKGCIDWSRADDIHYGFLQLGCCMVLFQALMHWFGA